MELAKTKDELKMIFTASLLCSATIAHLCLNLSEIVHWWYN